MRTLADEDGGRHRKPHLRCDGTGQVQIRIVDKRTGDVETHTVTCGGGSGWA